MNPWEQDDIASDVTRARARIGAQQSIGVNPDQYVEAKRIGAAIGAPADAVLANQAEADARVYMDRVDRLAATSPKAAGMLGDPVIAKQASDDLDNMSMVERLGGALRRSWHSLQQGFAATDLKANARMLADIDRALADPTTPDDLGVRQMSPEQIAQLRDSFAAPVQRQAAEIAQREIAKRATAQASPEVQAVQQAKTFGEAWRAFTRAPLDFITTTAAESALPSAAAIVPAIAGGVVAGPAGVVAGMGAGSFATDYGSQILDALRDDGVDVTNPAAVQAAMADRERVKRIGQRAFAHAAAVGALDAASGGVAGKTLAKSPLANVVLQTPVQGTLGAAGEVAGSVVSGQEVKPGEVLGEFFGEMVTTPADVGAAAVGRIRERRETAVKAAESAQALEQTLQVAEASKLRQRDPAAFREFLSQTTADATLLVDGKSFAQAFESLPPPERARIVTAVPTLAERLALYRETGADIEVSVADAGAHLTGTPLAQTIVEHGRTDPDAMTLAEARTFAQAAADRDAVAQAGDTAIERSLPDVAAAQAADDAAAQVRAQLDATGRFAAPIAEQYAKLTAAMYSTLAGRAGIPVQAFVEKYGAQIVSQIEARETFDQQRRGAYAPDSRTIALLERADLSTFVHELGHHGLETMVTLAAEAPGIAADVDRIMAYLGTDRATWAGMTLEQRRERHETFARSFEAYLFEGTAPSAELQSAFARMRAWLLQVYRQLASLRVELTDEVRGVFDRMLASDQEIAARSAPPMLTAKPATMPDADWHAYVEAVQATAADAVGDLSARTVRDMATTRRSHDRAVRRLSRTAEETRQRIEQEVSLEVSQERAFTARAALLAADAKGKIAAEDVEAIALAEPRFNRERLRGMASEQGLPADFIAEQFGFPDGPTMIRAIEQAGDPAPLVEAMVQERMLLEHTELSDARSIAEAADRAVANDNRVRVVATEYAALRKVGNTRENMAKARQAAETRIAGMRVDSVKPAVFRNAAAKAAKEADAALRAGDLPKAAAAKLQQLLSVALERQAHRVLEQFEADRRYLLKFTSEGVRKNLARDYLDQIDPILQKLNLRQMTNAEIRRADSLRAWIDKQQAEGMPVQLDAELYERAMQTPLKALTVEELRGLVDTVRQTVHLAQVKQRLLTARDDRNFDAAVQEAADSITTHAKREIAPPLETGSRIEWGKTWFRQYVAAHRTLGSFFRQMDGVQAGILFDLFTRPMNDRAVEETARRAEAAEQFLRIMEPVRKLRGGLSGGKVHIKALGQAMSREGRLAVALNMGNDANRQRLAATVPADAISEILGTLTAAEWDAVEAVWTMIDGYWPEISDKQFRLTGSRPEKVEASPFVVRVDGQDRVIRGGYYPIKYDASKDSRSYAHAATEALKQQMQGAYGAATTRRGHTKQRAEEVNRPLRLDLGVINEHINQVVHDLSWHEWLIDATRLLRAKPIEAAIRTGYGAEVLEALRKGIEDIAVGNLPAQNMFERGSGYLRAGATVAGLGLNLGSAVMQAFGVFPAIERVGAVPFARAVASMLGDAAHLESTVRIVREKSAFMNERGRTQNREVADVMDRLDKSKARTALDMSYFFFITKAQALVDMPTWLAAYRTAVEAGQADDRAVAIADEAVRATQSSGEISALPGVQRGSQLQKLFTTFYSGMSVLPSLTAEALHRTDLRSPASLARFGASLALLYVLPAVLSELTKDALKGGDDDSRDKGPLLDVLSYALGSLIGVRELSAAAQGFAGYSGPAGARFYSEASKLLTQALQGELDEPLLRSLNSAAGILFHYPAGALDRLVRGTRAAWEGDAPVTAPLFGPPKR